MCAEAVALGRAVLEGDGTVECAVALRHPKPDEAMRAIAIVPPCGACREMLMDFDPQASVILQGPAGPVRVPVPDTVAVPIPTIERKPEIIP